MASPILRQAMPCSTQKRRMPSSRWASVKPSAALGWEKNVGLKSSPMPCCLAQSIQRWKCSGCDLRPLDRLAAGLQVDGVEAEAVLAGNQAEGLVGVGPQLVGGAGPAGIVARGHDAAAGQSGRVLEAAHVVALPAVHGDGDAAQFGQRPIRVHAELGVALAGRLVRRFDPGGIQECTPSIACAGSRPGSKPKTLILPWWCRNCQGVGRKNRRNRPLRGALILGNSPPYSPYSLGTYRLPAILQGPVLGSYGWGTRHVQQPTSGPAMAQVGKMPRSGLGRLPALDRVQPLPARRAEPGPRGPRPADHPSKTLAGRGGS